MYRPKWKGAVEGYAANYTNKILWRVSCTHDRGDMMSEAYLVFLKCQAAYPRLDHAKHFMALYKTAIERRVADLSNLNRAPKMMVSENMFNEDEEVVWRRDEAGDHDNDGTLAVLIRQAPREVKMVLSLMLNAPGELLELVATAWNSKSPIQRRKGNEQLNRLLGPEVGVDPIGDVERYFS